MIGKITPKAMKLRIGGTPNPMGNTPFVVEFAKGGKPIETIDDFDVPRFDSPIPKVVVVLGAIEVVFTPMKYLKIGANVGIDVMAVIHKFRVDIRGSHFVPR